MSEEKVVNFNVDVAKKKVKEASDKAISVTSAKLKEATATIKEKTDGHKDKFMNRLVDRAIGITEKQMKALKRLKK